MFSIDHFAHIEVVNIIYSLVLVIAGYFLAKKTSSIINVNIQKRFSKHQAMLVSRIAFYFIFLMFFVSALNEIGFKLTVLLGTAGVFTVVLSFASQTAASNIISGIFLLFERPFKVGDTIVVKDLKGTVETMEWMATKIKTNDNLVVRIPNETLIKSDIINWSTLQNKRDEITLQIFIQSVKDIQLIKKALLDICKNNSDLLTKPAPKIEITKLIDNNIVEINLYYWTKSDLSLTKDKLLFHIMELVEAKMLVLFKEKEII